MNLKDQIEEAGLSACIQLLGYHTDLENMLMQVIWLCRRVRERACH